MVDTTNMSREQKIAKFNKDFLLSKYNFKSAAEALAKAREQDAIVKRYSVGDSNREPFVLVRDECLIIATILEEAEQLAAA